MVGSFRGHRGVLGEMFWDSVAGLEDFCQGTLQVVDQIFDIFDTNG
jgi:hypothetical protein